MKFARSVSILGLAVPIGMAMTRFITSRSGMMPDWMASLTIAALGACGVEQPIAPEDITDASVLGLLLACIATSILATCAISHLTRTIVLRTRIFIPLVFCSFSFAYGVAEWINDVVIAREQFKDEPDDFQDLYLAGVLLGSWLGALVASYACLKAIRRLRGRARHEGNLS